MYLATKDGSSCRIPERKAEYYKSMGYSLENLDTETVSKEEKKIYEKESATQEKTNSVNS